MRTERAGVWFLGLGQMAAYAGLYYGFAAMLPDLLARTGWGAGTLALGPTLGFLVAALLAPQAGKLVDRGWSLTLLTAGPLLAGAIMLGLSAVQTPAQWLVLWAALGVAQAISLYETCFGFLTRRLGPEARAAIVRITLVAGLAGSVSFPLGSFAVAHWGWRGALWAYAALLICIAAPVNRAGVLMLRRGVRRGPSTRVVTPGVTRRLLANPVFWALGGMLGLIWAQYSMLVTYSLPIFEDRGAAHALAVTAAALLGPSAIVSRFLLIGGGGRLGNFRLLAVILSGLTLAAVTLIAAGLETALIFVYVVVQGASIGVASIMRPSITAEVLGSEHFGAIYGIVSVFTLVGTALAPYLGSAFLWLGGVQLLLWGALGMILCAVLLAWLMARSYRAS